MRDKYSFSLAILAILSGIALLIYKYRKKVTISDDTINKANYVYSLLTENGFNDKLAKFATAQAAHETAGFTSNILKSNNNLYGMKYAKQITAQGEKNGYAYYLNWLNSVIDLISWYNNHRNKIFSLPLYINTLEDYVKFLKNNDYFEADESEYFKGCQYFYDNIFKN